MNESHEQHYERAARIDARQLAQRLRALAADQRAGRATIEANLRAQHWGHMPEGWHGA